MLVNIFRSGGVIWRKITPFSYYRGMKFKIFLTVLFSLIYCFATHAQTSYRNEFGFKSENDAYLAQGQDRYYTNGLFLYFRRAINPEKFKNDKLSKKIWSAEAGQKMYNAQFGNIPNIDYVDRPFAGYLYAGASLQWLYKNESVLKTSVQIGVVGPSSLAEEGQELYHNIFGFYELNGWQYQVKDEAALNFAVNYDRLLLRSESRAVDLTSSSEARIGNSFSGLKTGIVFRAGSLNPLYHSTLTQSNVAVGQQPDAGNKELYFFLKPSLDFVAYDATISGGLFRDDKGPKVFDSKSLVFSQEIGVAFSQKRWTIDFSLLFKTKEVKSIAKAHQYGILDVYYRFN